MPEGGAFLGAATGIVSLNVAPAVEALAKFGEAAEKTGAEAEASLAHIGDSLKSLGTKLTLGGTLPIVGLLGEAVKEAQNTQANLRQVNAEYGASADAVNKFAESSARSFGLSEDASLKASATIGLLGQQLGISADKLPAFDTGIQTAAGNLAKFKDADPAAVIQALTLGIEGNTRGLKQYGIILSAAQVSQEALNETGKTHTKDLTQAELAQARYNLIMQDATFVTANAGGASGSLGFQMRVLKAELSDFAARVGAVLLPALTSVFGVLASLAGHLQEINGPLLKIGVAVVLAVAALGPLLIVVGSLVSSVGLLVSPIGLVVAALVALGVAYKTNFLGFGDAVNAVAGAVGRLLTPLLGIGRYLLDIATGSDKSGAALTKLSGPFRTVAIGVGFVVAAARDFINVLGKDGLGRALDFLPQTLQSIGQGFQVIGAGLSGIPVVGTLAQLIFDNVGQAIIAMSGPAAAAGRIFADLTGFARDTATAFGVLRTAGFDPVSAGLKALGFALSQLIGPGPLPTFVSALGGLTTEIGRAAKALAAGDWTAALADLKAGFADVAPAALALGKAILDGIGNIDWGGIGGTLKTGALAALNAIGDLGGWILHVGIPTAVGWIETAGTWIAGEVKKALPSVGAGLASVDGWVLNVGIPTAVGWITSAASWLAGEVKQALPSVGSGLASVEGWVLNVGIPKVVGWIETAGAWIVGKVTAAINEAGKGLASVEGWVLNIGIPTAVGWITGAGAWIAGEIKKDLPSVGSGLASVEGWVLNVGLPTAVGWVTEAENWLIGTLAVALPAAGTKLADLVDWTINIGIPTGFTFAGDVAGAIGDAIKTKAGKIAVDVLQIGVGGWVIAATASDVELGLGAAVLTALGGVAIPLAAVVVGMSLINLSKDTKVGAMVQSALNSRLSTEKVNLVVSLWDIAFGPLPPDAKVTAPNISKQGGDALDKYLMTLTVSKYNAIFGPLPNPPTVPDLNKPLQDAVDAQGQGNAKNGGGGFLATIEKWNLEIGKQFTHFMDAGPKDLGDAITTDITNFPEIVGQVNEWRLQLGAFTKAKLTNIPGVDAITGFFNDTLDAEKIGATLKNLTIIGPANPIVSLDKTILKFLQTIADDPMVAGVQKLTIIGPANPLVDAAASILGAVAQIHKLALNVDNMNWSMQLKDFAADMLLGIPGVQTIVDAIAGKLPKLPEIKGPDWDLKLPTPTLSVDWGPVGTAAGWLRDQIAKLPILDIGGPTNVKPGNELTVTIPADKMKVAASGAGTDIGDAFTNALKAAMGGVNYVMDLVKAGLDAHYGILVAAAHIGGTNAGGAAGGSGFVGAFNQQLAGLSGVMALVKSGLDGAYGLLVAAAATGGTNAGGATGGGGFVGNFDRQMAGLNAVLASVKDGVDGWVRAFVPSMSADGHNAGDSFAQGFGNAGKAAIGYAQDIANGVTDRLALNLNDLGFNVGQSFASGLQSTTGAALAAGFAVGQAALFGAQSATGTFSPSRKFRALANTIMDSFLGPLRGRLGEVVAALGALVLPAPPQVAWQLAGDAATSQLATLQARIVTSAPAQAAPAVSTPTTINIYPLKSDEYQRLLTEAQWGSAFATDMVSGRGRSVALGR